MVSCVQEAFMNAGDVVQVYGVEAKFNSDLCGDEARRWKDVGEGKCIVST